MYLYLRKMKKISGCNMDRYESVKAEKNYL